MLTSSQIRDAEFSTVRVAAGYEMAEVDDLLDRLAVCLAEYEQGRLDAQLASDELAAVEFTQTRLREGYRTDEVDELLDQALEALRAYEALALRQPPLVAPGVPVETVPPGALAPLTGAAPSSIVAVPVEAVPPEAVAVPAAAVVPGPVAPSPVVSSVPDAPADYGLTVEDVVHRLQSLQAHQDAGLVRAPVQVRTPDGRTFTVAAVKSSTAGLVLTVSPRPA